MLLFIRSLAYNILFFGLTCPLLVIFSPALLLPPKASHYIAITWCRLNMWFLKITCNLECQLIGLENIPDHPVLFASKHQSTWETLAFTPILSVPVFILKKELIYIPFFGGFLKKAGMIAVDRKTGASSLKTLMETAKKRLARGRSIVIFPEGQRSYPGERPKYQRGILALYEALQVPVVPIALNSGLFWPRRAFIKKPGIITVQFLPPIPAHVERSQFMQLLEDTIETASAKLAERE